LYLLISHCLAVALVAVCAWTDIKTRTIFNIITYPTIAAGVAINIITGKYENIMGSLIIFAMYLFFFLSGKMGAGDLKLAVALSLLLGLQLVLLGSLTAGVILLVWGFASTWYRTGHLHTAAMVVVGRLPGGELP